MIRLCVPYIGSKELNAIAEVLPTGYLSQGEKVAQFEKIVSDYVGTKYAFATSSCTTALHLSLVALGIGPGDEVLVPDFTFPATANVVIQQHAIPILVDVDLDTLTISIDDLRKKITSKTKAVLPVHTFGLAADMEPILQLSKKSGFAVIEDAACALGGKHKGTQCGALGDIGCFSFHPRKSITTAEGGMILTNSDILAKKIKLLRSHGGVRHGGRFSFEEAGFNYRLSEIHGVIGIQQMKKLDYILTRKRELANCLSEDFESIEYITPQSTPGYAEHSYQSYVVTLDAGIDRDKVIKKMYERNIETTIGTYALHQEAYFKRNHGKNRKDLVNSKKAFDRTLTLPLYAGLHKKEMKLIADTLINLVNSNEVKY